MILTKLKLYAVAGVAFVVAALATYNKYLQKQQKKLQKELESVNASRKVEHKVIKDTAALKKTQSERKVEVEEKKRTRSQGLGGGRRES
jgi:C4-dicarboxylate-specific signal transduction histidine kinase